MSPSCSSCQTPFTIAEADLPIYSKLAPQIGGKTYDFPLPKECPDCRHRRRLAWRNERVLYPRKCDATGKDIVSIYAPDSPYVVYDRAFWWTDAWDATQYGRPFDFSRPFFEQFGELLKVVPKASLINVSVDNCPYANFQNDSKNCYLTMASGYMEDCQYCDWVYYAKNSFDCSFSSRSELDYMNVDCTDTYRCTFCFDSHHLSDCEHCFDCRNCQHCFGCVGLRGAKYHIFNKPYSQEDYEQEVRRLKELDQKQHVEEEIQKLKSAHPHESTRMSNCEDCTGDRLENCKNCRECFGVSESQDCAYMIDSFGMKDCVDVSRNGKCEWCYFIVGGGYNYGVSFSFLACYSSSMTYTVECMNSKNLFGCVGVQKKEYCILNVQYTKEEYEHLVPKIIEHMKTTGEWGEFFPPSISLFAYNESIAQDFYPLTPEQAKMRGFRWRPEEHKMQNRKTAENAQKEIIICERTGKLFKMTPQELDFYKKENLPTPTLHPNERYKDRLSLKLPYRLWKRTCEKCNLHIETPYAPDRPGKVVCEECYLKEVY